MRGLAFALTLLFTPLAATPTDALVVISHVSVLTLDDDRALPDQNVVVADGRIVAVGPAATTGVARGARVVDGTGKFLMPGLTDMHTHLAHVEDLAIYVGFGVTTVRNMWGAPIHVEWRDQIARGLRVGPTIVTAGPVLDGEKPIHDGSYIVATPDDVPAVIALHKRLGYDFVKIYSRLSPPVFARIIEESKRAGLPVAGHVPRQLTLRAVLDAHVASIEHLTGLAEALRGTGGEAGLPALASDWVQSGVWSCPTRVGKDAWFLDADARTRALTAPTMRYVPAAVRANWRPRSDEYKRLAADRAAMALDDRFTKALADAGGHQLIGSDPTNPFVIPGASVHDELAHWVAAGLSPLATLRAATRDAALFLGADDEFGRVRVGQRADLVLLDANPLLDIAATRRIAGVMVRGRWLGRTDLQKLLDDAAATIDGTTWSSPELLVLEGKSKLDARYTITWKDAFFGEERVAVLATKDGLLVRSQVFSPETGEVEDIAMWPGKASARLEVTRDGPRGRGSVVVTRKGDRVHWQGTALSGAPAVGDAAVPPDVLLLVHSLIASTVLLRDRLSRLGVDEALTFTEGAVTVGSEVLLRPTPRQAIRLADTPITIGTSTVLAHRYVLRNVTGSSATMTLYLDGDGWPLELDVADAGPVVHIVKKAK